jgi:dTDP-D-glucose 4,6-dehydratase
MHTAVCDKWQHASLKQRMSCFVCAQGETGEVYNIGTEKERTVKEVRHQMQH